ncbi:squalene/phytoene synthase family protein [Allosphingosinicella flava]|uniref:Squalene/phytoene synthase family protein n=1 Tax=Allosphingosinicella flava TaxID=2771430 RepID=A0A7T2LMN1_9SPHN|nr:squalene/phytoene synthase family protein [Sphingosinicella flava]QPQ55736.1 squalene/phytoene synthase family protein [Sphingosinicella flava]
MLDPDRTLALAYVPARHREAVRALWTLDAALGAALTTGREPAIRQIKLAWWREALERLDTAPAPAEPVLQALETHVLPRGVAGGALAGLEEGWRMLLAGNLDGAALDIYAAERGGLLFRLTAQLLAASSPAPNWGEGWALADLARNASDPGERNAALIAAWERLRDKGTSMPRAIRPLTMLAKLARRDASCGLPFEPQGAPRRMAAMLAHRLTGR